MKSEETDRITEEYSEWVWRFSEGDSERGIFCPRCGEPIPIAVTQIDDEVRSEESDT
jgi:hypothetical protein